MSTDELAEINGIKPNYLLNEGEEKEVTSKTSDAKYKVKRTADHFYCTCPAWRNQSGVPVNARSCKHLLILLGEQYEEARLEHKNPGGPPPKGLPVRKTSKQKSAKPVSSKRVDDKMDVDEEPPKSASSKSTKQIVNDDMDIDEEPKKPRSSKSKPRSNVTSKMKDEDEENSDAKVKKPSSKKKPVSAKRKRDQESSDEEENPVTKKPASKKGKTAAKLPGKSRKNISETEDDSEEDEKPRKSKKISSSKGKAPAQKSSHDVSETEDDSEAEDEKRKPSKKPSSSKGRTPAKRPRKDVSETEDDSDQEEEIKKPSRSKKPISKRRKVEEEDRDGEDTEKDDGGDGSGDDDGDELDLIKGIKPNVLMKDGEEREVQSQTSSSTYKVKRTFDHYYCTCPAWRNQGGVPVNARSCKHLIALLGEKYEAARIKLKNPDGATLRSPKKKGASKKSKGKKGDGDGDDDDDGASKVNVLLANSWDVDKGPDPTGWWISEKLDGVRTYYDGKRMFSRLGNPFTPPQWFLDKLPKDVTLDGELFGGRGEFQNTVSIVKTMNSPHWKGITFHVFDIPSIGNQPFEARMERLKELFGPGGSHASDKVVFVEQTKAKGREHVLDELKEVESLGGEGLMLRKPGSQYEGKRSSTLLKIKSFYDAEAVVIGHKDGKGRNTGVTGALKCKMASGKTFDVGSGLNDKQRKNPPKIGSIIVYRFQELTKDGVPRFPTFLGEAVDKTKPKDAAVPDHRKGSVKKTDV